MSWKNRIVGAGTEDPEKLVPHPKNWRKHPKGQAAALEGAIEEIGWIQDIIINQRTGRMIDGHLRAEIAIKNKEKSVPVKYVDLSEEEEEKALLTLDPISMMAEADKDRLADLLQTVTSDNEKVSELIKDIGYRYDLIKFNPIDEWKEMPEYKSEDLTAFKSLIIHFRSEEAYINFGELLGQPLPQGQKKTLWYPPDEILHSGRVVEE